MANELYYPHGISFGGTFIGQAEELGLDTGVEELTQYASGDYAPGFTGAKEYAPEFRLDTQDVLGLFTLIGGGTEDLHRKFAAGNVDLQFRAADNLGTRVAVGTASHELFRATNNTMLYWDSFRVSQSQECRVETRTITNSISGAAPVVQIANQAITASPDLALFTLGKVVLNGTTFDRLNSVNWNNNVNVEREPHDGEAAPSFGCIDQIRPVVQFETKNLAQVAGIGFDGLALTTFDVYLRKRRSSRVNFPDADTVHIKLACTAGSAQFSRVSGDKTSTSCRALLNRPSGGGQIWTITTGVAIP